MTAPFDYLRDPQAIYDRSFALVREATDLRAVPASLRPLVIRLVHACGMPDIVDALEYSNTWAEAAHAALARGAPVFADCEMVAHGITRARLPADNAVVCTLNEPDVPARARRAATTRSAAAVDGWGERVNGAVVAIGNAPTALFRLLELMADGARPAAIAGFPVGFVGAAESKRALAAHHCGVPFVTLHGRRGGSALAAAAVNAASKAGR